MPVNAKSALFLEAAREMTVMYMINRKGGDARRIVSFNLPSGDVGATIEDFFNS